MPESRSPQGDIPHQKSDPYAAREIELSASSSESAACASPGARRQRELPQSLAALSIALLVVGMYASVCLHLGGPRMTLVLLSLIATVWLFAAQRPWQAGA